MKKTIFWLLVLNLTVFSAAFAGGRRLNELPAPRLMAPDDIVDLAGKNSLEFRWGNETSGSVDHYDFRLYKGTQTYEKNLILQKDVPQNKSSLLLDASTFKVGETYAWSLRSMGSKKSMSSYSIFKIRS